MQRPIAWRKRLFDVAGAAGGLVAFSPVMAAIAVAILLEDGRPILFRQERVGKAAWWPYRSRSTRSEKPAFDGSLIEQFHEGDDLMNSPSPR